MKRKGFTLIELLVVIAVVGLLASIVLINLRSTRGRANIGAGKQYDSQLRSTLGAYILGGWRFEQGSGDTASDDSAGGKNGNLAGSQSCPGGSNCPIWRTEVECNLGLGGCLEFDGDNDFVSVPYFNESKEEFTISFWVQLKENADAWNTILGRSNEHNGGWRVYQNNGSTTLAFGYQASDAEKHWILPSGNLQLNTWYHVAVAFSVPQLKAQMYINGKIISTSTGAANVETIGNTAVSFMMGARDSGGGAAVEQFRGLIDEVALYEKALSITEIQRIYAIEKSVHVPF